MKNRWLCVLPAVACALVLAGCGGSSSGSGKTGGTFRMGTSSGIDSINPYVAFNQDAYSTFQYIYPILVQYDSHNHFAPFFARSWKASDGGKTWTFHLVKGAKWTDGQPLTSADAAWTINTDIKYASGGAASDVAPTTGIQALKNAGFEASDVPGLDQTDFIINSNPRKKSNRELLNLKVKEAFAHAVDRSQIIRVVFLGTAKPAYSIIPPTTPGWSNPNLKPETFDLAQANKILDGLGYKKGSDGIRVAGGHKMSYQV